ncbi:MAG: DUF1501 domain-containing protein [Candidatus Omnitrophica bacterium]|nr:hypothetical protein [bacterium]NUN97273.1 DUF1501 domain-containing protein [Candidatus Omnitrophota bacterium]
MDPVTRFQQFLTRRRFFGLAGKGIGAAALASLLGKDNPATAAGVPGVMKELHHLPKAKRVIYLAMAGGPSHIDLYDHKPKLKELHGTELPASVRMNQRLTGMTSGQSTFPVVSPFFSFAQHGNSGQWISELLPHISTIADEMCILKSLNTEAINHDPAHTYIQTGSQQPGRPSIGSWVSYGLGTDNESLPAYLVLISKGSPFVNMQPLFDRLWGPGFLPSQHQGVKFRAGADPVLYLSNPPGVSREGRRAMLDGLAELNKMQHEAFGDPEIETRIAQYEMAFRMQTSVPELVDVSDEPEHVFELYGEDARRPGTFAANCLLARRLAERGVRFIQLFHRGWDQHNNLMRDIRSQSKDVDQGTAALVKDLKQRGMLEDTLLIWGGEFGRTVYSQGALNLDTFGRDHHGRCFTMWLAGAGVKHGISYGATDDYCYNVVENPVHIHDLNATILHILGINHEHLTYKFQGRDFRLTDVHGRVVHDILA